MYIQSTNSENKKCMFVDSENKILKRYTKLNGIHAYANYLHIGE